MAMSANDVQVGGDHYKTADKIEHWDVVAQFNLDYFQGQITKYIMRWRKKGGIQDLKKAKHYLEKYIEVEEEKYGRQEKEKKDYDSKLQQATAALQSVTRGVPICVCHAQGRQYCEIHGHSVV